jgi:hypothetical protein
MAATLRRKRFPRRCAASSRSKLFAPAGPPLRFGRKPCNQPGPRGSDHNKDVIGATLVQVVRTIIFLDQPGVYRRRE